MLDGFSNFASSVFILTFSPFCCYFIIYISIWSFFDIYIELNCYCNQLNCCCLNNSLSLNGYIYLKIQRAILLDLAMLYRYSLWQNYNFKTKFHKKILNSYKKKLHWIIFFRRTSVDKVYDIIVTPFLLHNLVFFVSIISV